MVSDEPTVVRPPEFEKVLEELQVVRLGDNLKSEIQARRDLEDIYQRLLQEFADLETAVEEAKISVDQAEQEARRAVASEQRAKSTQTQLQNSLTRIKVVTYTLAVIAAALAILSWDRLSNLFLALVSLISA